MPASLVDSPAVSWNDGWYLIERRFRYGLIKPITGKCDVYD